jgi:hypothetical protein
MITSYHGDELHNPHPNIGLQYFQNQKHAKI